LLAPPALLAEGKADSKSVQFRSSDGVELSGTYYPNDKGKKDAVVLLLHNFDAKKGGNSHADRWDDLAAKLQAEGYAVLQFDFRGFGDSKTVGADFWDNKNKHNLGAIQRALPRGDPPTTIDHKNFKSTYYPYLVNDIAAAKAYLDRRNDANEVNSSNLIIIGAGEGATLGALWLNSECFRCRDKAPKNLGLVVHRPGPFEEPEIKDVACAIWLSISPRLGGRAVPFANWLLAAGKGKKVPMAFVYGADDPSGKSIALNALTRITGSSKGHKNFPLTGKQEIKKTSLTGSALLRDNLGTSTWIVEQYLSKVPDKRKNKERLTRGNKRARFYYVNPKAFTPRLAKDADEDAGRVDISLFMATK
jgi:pimeloyl-ACP methyl ester carboxylesterase